MNRPARQKVPMRNVRIACIRQKFVCKCGCEGGLGAADVTIDHNPPLIEREVNEDRTDYIPAQADPAYLDIYLRGHDRNKTFGSGGTQRITTRDGDIGRLHHNRRAKAKHESHVAIMKAKHGR